MSKERIQEISTQEAVTRLAKPKRKGILGLIFSRFFIIVLLILLELAVLILPIILLQDWLHHYIIALLGFTLIIMLYLFNSKMDVQRYALIQYIQDNYRDITLSDLSNKFHYTNEYTSRLIKELTGMTYTEILRTIRIERSESFLETTTMTVANIAEAVGYDTPEHYIRQFKKHTGMTPSAYRKQSPKNILE